MFDTQHTLELTEQAVAQRFGDEWQDLREEVSTILQQNPHFVPDTPDPYKAAEAIGFIADGIRAKRLAERSAQLSTQQEQAAHTKRLAQTAPGAGGSIPRGIPDRDTHRSHGRPRAGDRGRETATGGRLLAVGARARSVLPPHERR